MSDHVRVLVACCAAMALLCASVCGTSCATLRKIPVVQTPPAQQSEVQGTFALTREGRGDGVATKKVLATKER